MKAFRLVVMTCAAMVVCGAALGQAIDPAMFQQVTAPATTQPAATQAVEGANVGQIVSLAEKRLSNLKLEDIKDVGFWLDFGKDAIYWAVAFIPRLLVALFLLVFFWLVYRGIRKIVVGGVRAAGVDSSIADMLGLILKWGILGFGLIIAGNQVGIQIAALLTGVSIIGLAVGFAAQDSISNFISGIMIFWDKPFKVGDWILIDGHLGQVMRVTFRSTRLQDLDGDVVVFPNAAMLNQKVINKSANPVTRCNVLVGIAYKESVAKARKALLELVSRDSRIEKKPEPEVIVKSLGASSVDLVLHFWIREERYEDAMQYEYTERAKVALDEAGVEIPFPHVQLLLEQTPAVNVLSGKPAA